MHFAGFRIPEPAAAPVVKSWLSSQDREELRHLGDELSLAQRTILTARKAGKPLLLAAAPGTGCRTALRWAAGVRSDVAPDRLNPPNLPESVSDTLGDGVILQRSLPNISFVPSDLPPAARFHTHTTDLRNIRLFAPWRDEISPDPERVRLRLATWLAERRSEEPVLVLYGEDVDPSLLPKGSREVSFVAWPAQVPRGKDLILWNPPMCPSDWLSACAATGDFAAGGSGCTILVDSPQQMIRAAALKWLFVLAPRRVEGDDRAAVTRAWDSLVEVVRDWDAACRFRGESAVLELVTRLGVNRGNAWIILHAVREGLRPW